MSVADGIGRWIRRYGIWTLVLVTGVLVLFAKLFPTANRGPLKALKVAEEKTQELHERKREELDAIRQEFREDRQELRRARLETDERERLQRLADIANRRGGK